ncbi:PRC-barrel domain containing protein [Streptomyces subrutilus]|uniref:PRC-barrel domain containing protein n=1 Tax=Streptomyces subrutilus TaxID=36818 RepID=UPI003990898B
MNDTMWAYRTGIIDPTGEDLIGFSVEAVDGGIGKVDKHSVDVSDAYLVVDTGVWIFGKEVMLPAGTVTGIDREARTVYVDRTKEQIKSAPEFHRAHHLGDPDYRNEITKYYGGMGPLGGPLV